MKRATFVILLMASYFQLFPQAKSNTKIAKQFLSYLQKSKFNSAIKLCDTIVSNKIDAERLRHVWVDLQEQVGDFKERKDIWTEQSNGYEKVYQACKFENSIFDLQLTFNS